MYQNNSSVQFFVPKVRGAVKWLLILSVAVFLVQLVGEKFFELPLTYILGFVPKLLLTGWVWQPFTYAFLHSGPFHLLFNLLVIWSIGSELEGSWGSPFFLFYFFCCTVGAALTYGLFAAMGIGGALSIPVVGSSGAVYGMLLAYGVLFGERVLYFFMIFPMRAKYFVMILGGVVLVSTVFYSNNGIAHTAHLGGMVAGLLVLYATAIWKQRSRLRMEYQKKAKERKQRVQNTKHLRLIKDDGHEEDSTPHTWH